MKHLILAVGCWLLAVGAAGQETYTRTYRADSLGTAKWYLYQIDTWTAPVPSFSADSAKSVQENRFFAPSKADLINLVSSLRQQAADQKSAAERDMARADSMYSKLSNLYARLTDSAPDDFPLRRSAEPPPSPASLPQKGAKPKKKQ